MEEKKIKIERVRNTQYVCNFKNPSMTIVWPASKNKQTIIRELSQEHVNELLMNSACFDKGELKIIEDSDEAKEIVKNIANYEAYINNTHSKEDIIKILKATLGKFKSELNKITERNEKAFVVDVAKEIKLDNATKRNYLAKWANMKVEVIFGEIDAEDMED